MAGTARPDLLREARERYAAGIDADRLNRLRDQEDRKFYTGGDNQWTFNGKNIAAERRKEGRPAESYNRLPQFVKQVSGELRQNKPAIKVLPVDGQTDPEMAGSIRRSSATSRASRTATASIPSRASRRRSAGRAGGGSRPIIAPTTGSTRSC
jgi:hypothetical protein